MGSNSDYRTFVVMARKDPVVCPGCGSSISEDRECRECGEDLWEHEKLPLRSDWELDQAAGDESAPHVYDEEPEILDLAKRRVDAVSASRQRGDLGFRDVTNPVYRTSYALRYFLGRPNFNRYRFPDEKQRHRTELEKVVLRALAPGEQLLASGYTNDHRVAVITSQRLISIKSKKRLEAHQLTDVSDIRLAKLAFSGVVKCRVKPGLGGTRVFTIFPLEEAVVFDDVLRRRAAALQPPVRVIVSQPAAPDHALATSDALETLQKLAELHDAGILSDEEFSEKKTELLKRI